MSAGGGRPEHPSGSTRTTPGTATRGRADRARQTGWRAGLRRTPGGALFLQAAVFVLGALFILLGLAALVLPGPLTIPPVLLGLYVWSSEFDWADRLLARARERGVEALAAARRRPISSAVTTVGGLVAAGGLIWAAGHYHLVARAQHAVGV